MLGISNIDPLKNVCILSEVAGLLLKECFEV